MTIRVLIVVNVDWFFLSHRLPVALGALRAGHEVHLAMGLTGSKERLESYGFVVHPLTLDRNDAGPFAILKLFLDFWRLFRSLRPNVLHLVTIKPVLIGGLAARFAPVGGVVYAISGLGHVFVSEGWLGQLRRKLVGIWYRAVLSARNIRIIFQNPEDQRAIQSIVQLESGQAVLIPGSGVNLSEYQMTPLPSGVPVVLMAARLLTTKGVHEFVSAAELLHKAGVQARFCLVGDPDPGNPASISNAIIDGWRHQGVVEIWGHRTDIADLMAQAFLVVLPSYREGLPKVLIEAAACGRAVITTDVPGCRDAIVPGVTGVLVPPKNAAALAEAIQKLMGDPLTCAQMGHAGRQHAETLFDVQSVVKTHLDLYQGLAQQK